VLAEQPPATDRVAGPERAPEAQVLRAPLLTGAGRPVGQLDLYWPRGAAVGGSVVEAFARHLGIALERHLDADRSTAPDEPAFPWDDPDRLPGAIGEITAHVTELVRPLTGATAVGITVWDPELGVLIALPGAFGATDGILAASVTGPPTNMLSASVRVLVTGQPYLSNQASGDPGVLQPYVELFDIHRILSVALDCGGRRIGVLHLANKADEFTTADIAAVEAIAPQVAAAVQLARSVARMAARQRLEGMLGTAAVAIASGLPSRESLLPAFDELAEGLGARLVALVPREGAPLIRRAGPVDPWEARVLADAREHGDASSGAYPHRAGDPGWSALHAPVDAGGERTATLSVLRRTGEPFTADEEYAVTRLARLVGLAWTSERYQRQLAEIALLRERERIADGLHDRVAQILFAARLGIDSLLDGGVGSPPRERLLEIRQLLNSGDTAIREVIHRISTGPGNDLERRLARAAESVGEEFGVVVRVELGTLPGVARHVADAALKVAREGMVNAAKHAGPCRIALAAERTGGGDGTVGGMLEVSVTDDGLGLGRGTSVSAGYGLGSLHRAVADAGGELSVTTAPDGLGARVEARFPL
jgi:signal transduction histidine kinase